MNTLSIGVHTISLAATDRGGKSDTASVQIEVVSQAANTAPVVRIIEPPNGFDGTEVTPIAFRGSATDAEDGPLSGTSVVWNSSIQGDFATDTTAFLSLQPGVHTITLRATDSGGMTSTDVVTLSVRPNALPTVDITAPVNGSTFSGGVMIDFEAEARDEEDLLFDDSQYAWVSSLDGNLGTGQQISASLPTKGVHTITVTVTDKNGGQGTDSIQITVQ